jgi:hypothetical protein
LSFEFDLLVQFPALSFFDFGCSKLEALELVFKEMLPFLLNESLD